MVYKKDWLADKQKFFNNILSAHTFPFIAKPVMMGAAVP
jgi:hypothetical protein